MSEPWETSEELPQGQLGQTELIREHRALAEYSPAQPPTPTKLSPRLWLKHSQGHTVGGSTGRREILKLRDILAGQIISKFFAGLR